MPLRGCWTKSCFTSRVSTFQSMTKSFIARPWPNSLSGAVKVVIHVASTSSSLIVASRPCRPWKRNRTWSVGNRSFQASSSPHNVYDLRSELVAVSKFIPNYANMVEPLRSLERSTVWRTSLGLVSFRLSNVSFLWRQSTQFRSSSTTRSRNWWPALAWFRLDAPTYVFSDARPLSSGAVLLQHQGNGDQRWLGFV